MDSSLMSNILKLFYERIEVFGAVEFNKLSIVTGIIKIALKVRVCVCGGRGGEGQCTLCYGCSLPSLYTGTGGVC